MSTYNEMKKKAESDQRSLAIPIIITLNLPRLLNDNNYDG